MFKQPTGREHSQVSKDANSQKDHRRHKDNSGTYSAISAFRQWRKNGSMGNRSSSVGSSLAGFTCLSTDPFTIKKLELFPLLLSDATIPDEDLSLKFLALVKKITIILPFDNYYKIGIILKLL